MGPLLTKHIGSLEVDLFALFHICVCFWHLLALESYKTFLLTPPKGGCFTLLLLGFKWNVTLSHPAQLTRTHLEHFSGPPSPVRDPPLVTRFELDRVCLMTFDSNWSYISYGSGHQSSQSMRTCGTWAESEIWDLIRRIQSAAAAAVSYLVVISSTLQVRLMMHHLCTTHYGATSIRGWFILSFNVA